MFVFTTTTDDCLKMILFPSWPGLSRPSTSFLPNGGEDVDARHNDVRCSARFFLSQTLDGQGAPIEGADVGKIVDYLTANA
jgi:hypothetical protein